VAGFSFQESPSGSSKYAVAAMEIRADAHDVVLCHCDATRANHGVVVSSDARAHLRDITMKNNAISGLTIEADSAACVLEDCFVHRQRRKRLS